MKYFRYALLAVALILCVTMAMANREPVTLALWPDTVTAFVGFGYSVTLPLFVIVVGAIGIGLVLGLVWEWLRERAQRKEAAQAKRELQRVQALHGAADPAPKPGNRPRDQVLSILNEADERA